MKEFFKDEMFVFLLLSRRLFCLVFFFSSVCVFLREV